MYNPSNDDTSVLGEAGDITVIWFSFLEIWWDVEKWMLSELHINYPYQKYREIEESHCKALIHESKFVWVKQTEQGNGKSEGEENILCICIFKF